MIEQNIGRKWDKRFYWEKSREIVISSSEPMNQDRNISLGNTEGDCHEIPHVNANPSSYGTVNPLTGSLQDSAQDCWNGGFFN
jgi:hypothetical protein